MKKRELTREYNQIKEAARNLKLIAEQQIALAARLESTAITALNELGVQQGRARKSKEIPEAIMIDVMARMA